ncbi:MAG: hypothetical protein KIH63_004620 [Candidatus Saccharibacteria bacterium]|nr:hypothetical protein [Candidatus Saccharibacteria bacterium]
MTKEEKEMQFASETAAALNTTLTSMLASPDIDPELRRWSLMNAALSIFIGHVFANQTLSLGLSSSQRKGLYKHFDDGWRDVAKIAAKGIKEGANTNE